MSEAIIKIFFLSSISCLYMRWSIIYESSKSFIASVFAWFCPKQDSSVYFKASMYASAFSVARPNSLFHRFLFLANSLYSSSIFSLRSLISILQFWLSSSRTAILSSDAFILSDSLSYTSNPFFVNLTSVSFTNSWFYFSMFFRNLCVSAAMAFLSASISFHLSSTSSTNFLQSS